VSKKIPNPIRSVIPHFILKGKEVVKCDNVLEWAKWYETADRTVKITVLRKDPEMIISTVFLGVAYHGGQFETMIFGANSSDQYQVRYDTYDEALKGHEELENMIID